MGYAIFFPVEDRSASKGRRTPRDGSTGSSSPDRWMAQPSMCLRHETVPPGALSPHLQRITTSPDIFPMPITSASRPSETAPALPGYERNTAYTAEVIPFPGANPDERPMNPGGGGGGVESGLRLRSYGNHICAVLLVSLIVSCKYWIPFVMAAGPALGPSLVALIVFLIATIRKDLPFGSAFFLNCSILLIVVAAFYLPLMVAPAILGSVIAIIGLALR